MPTSPFTDPSRIPSFYGTPARLQRRTSALLAAKVAGRNATEVLTQAVAAVAPQRAVLADFGCGRGSLVLSLATQLRPARMLAIDTSLALLRTVAARAVEAGAAVETVQGDFHDLPLTDGLLDVATAAFCLYHSEHPAAAVAEIGRCLTGGGHAVMATKSAGSYRELDELLASTGLDPDATARTSLYATFHSSNAAATTEAAGLEVLDVTDEKHRFRFDGPAHLAGYLVTVPKYRLPADLADDPQALADELVRRGATEPVTTTSTVTYVTARRTT